MITRNVEKSKNNLDQSESYWNEALNISGFNLSHLVLCFEGYTELGLLKWLKNKGNWLTLTEVHKILDILRAISLKNNIISSLSKFYLIQAKLSFSLNESAEANQSINDCLKIPNKPDLDLIKVLSQIELQKIKKRNLLIKDKILDTDLNPVAESNILEIQRMLKSLGG